MDTNAYISYAIWHPYGIQCSIIFHLKGDEVRTTLSEPNFATKMAATCAVDAETFSEAQLS